jgi:multidrug efflux pump subunit AcrA (membrane-fusion protein)
MAARTGTPWFVYALAALAIGAIVAAILVVGPASSGQAASVTRTVTAQRGVVQSTVSGSGNIEPASELDLGFKTSGTVTQIDVTQGEHVAEGQLIATLDPQSAEVTLEQAKASLQSAEASLAREQETNGEGSSQSSGSESGKASIASFVATKTQPATTTSPTSPTSATTPTTTTPSTTTPSATRPAATKAPAGGGQSGAASGSSSNKRTSDGSSSSAGASSGSGGSSTSGSSASGSSAGTPLSAATREANLASARAAVKSDRLTVKSDEQAVADTRLIAPQDGTIVSLSGEVGETVSGGGTSRASTSSEGSSSNSSSATGAGGLGASVGSTGSSSSSKSSSSGSTGSSFAVLSDLSAMKLVVPLSESEIGSVKAGQPATVAIEALKGLKLAAHISEVAALPTSNSGVVSYDVTFALDQLEAGLKAGMSATAEVVVSQAEGVNVPTSAISGGAVTVTHDGKQQRRAVTAGLAGDSSTIILSGLQAGEQVVLPVASTSTSSATSLLSRLAGRTGGGTLGGAGGGVGGFGGGGFARGGALRGGPGG